MHKQVKPDTWVSKLDLSQSLIDCCVIDFEIEEQPYFDSHHTNIQDTDPNIEITPITFLNPPHEIGHSERFAGKDLSEIIEDFVQLRDTLAAERKAFKTREEEIKLDMELLEAEILTRQRALGVKSVSTSEYTAFQTEKVSVRLNDWDTFSSWILATGNIQCLEKRCAKLACLEMEKDASFLVMGLDKITETCVQVRRK